MSPTIEKDACELLDADHIAAKHLFVEYARLAAAPAGEPGAKQRQLLAARIARALAVHMQVEEEIFYPALRDAQPAAAQLLEEAQQEHQQAKELVARIEAAGEAGAELDELVALLARAVEHHVKEERTEVFPKAKAAPGLDLAELAGRMLARQQALQAEAGARG